MKKYDNVADRKDVARFSEAEKDGLWCPNCNSPRSIVYDSRPAKIAGIRRRRRACLDCGARFTSKETYENEPPLARCAEAHRHAEWLARHTRAAIVGACISLAVASAAYAGEHRSRAALDAFQHAHPCPSTGLTHPICERGAGRHWHCHRCPGYVIDHTISLFCGGADDPVNMTWMTIEDAKAKDKWENKGCREL